MGFYGPRSKRNARLLVNAARELGYPTSVVKTTMGGYNAPDAVVNEALGVEEIKEGVEYPAPSPEPASIPVPEPDPEPVQETAPKVKCPKGNASRGAWAAYAQSLGVTVDDRMTRNQIRDLAKKE